MHKETLDCRGLACPVPVVESKKKLSEMAAGTLTVLVDNETAKNNVLKLAGSLNLDAAAREEDGIFAVTVLHDAETMQKRGAAGGKIILVTADTMGRGSDELGVLLIKSYFYALAEGGSLPDDIYLVNGAVKLACEGSAVAESLKALESSGVGIHSCGMCLDFFNLKEKLLTGDVTNMYAIVEALAWKEAVIL